MAIKKPSVSSVLYTLLIILGILLHMILSGEAVGPRITAIGKDPFTLFETMGFFVGWTFRQVFSVNGLFVLGVAAFIEFIATPLMQKYKMIAFRTTFSMSVVAAIYVLFLGRILGVILGI